MMEILDIMTLIVIGTFIIVLGLFGIKMLLKLGRAGITIIFNMILGIIFLFVVNLLPIVKIPINLLTVLVAGFGGIIGVGVLVIAKSMGLY
jgi:inhibitor of the pro-sigma K processing machinery